MNEFEFEMDAFEADPETSDTYAEFESEFEFDAEDEEELGRRRTPPMRSLRRAPPRRPPRRPRAQRPRPRPPQRPGRPGRRPSFFRDRAPCICPAHGTEFVRWVQSSLNQLLSANLPVNGIMNRASRAALRRFQQQRGLPADGIAGPDTERALQDAKASGTTGAAPNPTLDPASDSITGDNPPPTDEYEFDAFEWEWEDEVNRGSRDYIIWVQSSLNRVHGTRLATDGISGPLTRSAIRSFQTSKRLAADGIVGPITEAALIAAGASQPPGAGSTPTPAPRGGSGDTGVTVELPLSGPGFYSYDRTSAVNGQPHQFGRRATIDAIKAIGAAWQRAHPRGPRIGIGHISLRGGGDTPSHAGHETGLEVDVRPMRSDGAEAAVTIYDAKYSRALTQEVVDLFRANRILSVSRILFNDLAIPGVRQADNHHHHLHVEFT